MTTLTQQLADYQVGFKQTAPAVRVAVMEAATARLRATGIESAALQVGAHAGTGAVRCGSSFSPSSA